MKFLPFFLAFFSTLLGSSMMIETKDMETQHEANLSLMDTLITILNDPEFVLLEPEQQMRILVIIYAILEKRLLNRNLFKAKAVF